MAEYEKLTARVLSALFIALILITVVSANSAEPPGLTLIVNSAPDDLTLFVRFTDDNINGSVRLHKERRAWETYYRFFYHDLYDGGVWFDVTLENAALIVSSGEKSFEILLSASDFGYNSFLTLDFMNESISAGRSLTRLILLVSMRVILTLIIEGVIFFLFRYRKKSSWGLFIIVNLLTQTILNIILSGPNLSQTYWLFGLIILEIIILIAEMLAYTAFLGEHTKKRAVFYALAANYASFSLGYIFLSYLPV